MIVQSIITPLRILAASTNQPFTLEKSMPAAPKPNYEAIKTKQNAAWSSGDYAKVGITLQITGEELAEATNPAPGASVLDVAGGNGNATLAFARRWCRVTSTDYVESLLDRGRMRAEADGLEVNFQTADAENLPFEDGSYDMVVSTFGVMFTPDQEKSAEEMVRVCRSGGTIAMANWTRTGFIGALFKTLGLHVPPPEGLQSPAQWGDQYWIEGQFGSAAKKIEYKLKNFNFRYASPRQFLEFFRTFYGPVHKAFAALDARGQSRLETDILQTISDYNVATDGSMIVPSQYAQIVILKQ